MSVRFPFKIRDVMVGCAHCGHQLGEREPVEAQFGLDLIRCDSCSKFTQVQSDVLTARVKTPVQVTE